MTRSNGLVRSLENGIIGSFLIISRWLGKGWVKSPVPQGPHRALICKWCCMGDAILTLYAIRDFKRLHPEVALDVLISSRISEVYRRAPEIENVYVLPVTGRNLFLELLNPRLWYRLLSMLASLRKKRYAQFIDLELYRSTGPVLKRLIGIPFARGFQVEGAPPKNHDYEVPRPKDMPEWQCFYQVFGLEIPSALPAPLFQSHRTTGASTLAPPTDTPAPMAADAPAASSSAHETSFVRGTTSKRRVGIVYGSSFNWPQKKWPWEYYADTISLLEKEGYQFVLFGTEFEKEEGKKIAARAKGDVVDTTGELDWNGLQKEVAACDLVVGNDTGTLHLASACGIPTLTLFGPTNPKKWNGLTSSSLFLESVQCRPCYYLGSMPPCDHFSCLRKMAPAMVVDKIRALLV